MITPIGNAVCSPPIPTNGADKEPSKNGNNPNNADALPAKCPFVSIANEKDDVPIILIDITKRKIGIATAINGACTIIAITSKKDADIERTKPLFKKVFSENLESLPTICVPIINPIPFIPNNKLKT